MDNNELTLNEIIARQKGTDPEETAENETEDVLGDAAELRDTDELLSDEVPQRAKLTVDEILAGEPDDSAETVDGPDDQPHGLTVDEILDGITDSDDESSNRESAGLTVDEILNEPEPLPAVIEEIDDNEEAQPDREVSDDDDDGFDDRNDDREYDDEDDIDSAPTMIMPKNRQRTERSSRPVRQRPRRKKKKAVHKRSFFNGSIFGGIILTCIILTVSIVLAITGISVATEYYGIGKSDNDVIFNIPKGSSNEDIADLLYENGIINNKTLFLMALKIEKPETIYPGDITLQASMGYPDVIEQLATLRDPLKTVNVTITEGMNLLDVATLLEKSKVCKADEFLFEFNKNQGFEFEKDLGVSKDAFYKMEGYFYPETYNFYVNDTPYNVTKIVREQFQSVLTADLMRQIKASKFSLNQIMILASIVQMEAGKESEMPMVASVFVNRMNDPDTYKNLQSDTTSKYIEKVIKKKAIDPTSVEFYSAVYDTYTCVGLPASPICNPGLAAIKAVLEPAKTDYYYFCNNLATGETFFARTLEEHNANLKKAGLA